MARSRTTFAKGNKSKGGRPPKAAEQSELERWKRIVDPEARDNILRKISEQAQAGKPWAINIIAERLWPAAFMGAKFNEKDGAKDAAESATDAMRQFLASLKASVNGGIA